MDKLEYLAVIKFFTLDGLTPTAFHPMLTKVYRKSANSILTVKKQAVEFKRGHKLLEKSIENVHNIMLDDAKALRKAGATFAECRSKAN